MDAQDDLSLLREYAKTGSSTAFARVVARHADFVFATAYRQTRSRDLAEDVTQATFIVLARRARSMRDGASVAGFLHQTTIFAAKNALRAEARRRRHERDAAVEAVTTSSPPNEELLNEDAVAVDSALARLRNGDRQFLTLHYFDGLKIDDLAERLRISREAARKRLHRALARLRAQLTRRGATTTVSALPATIEAMTHPSVSANPSQIASTAVAGGNGGSAFELAFRVLQQLRFIALQKAIVGAGIAAILVTAGAVAVTKMTRPPTAVSRQVKVSVPVTPNMTAPPTPSTIVDYAAIFSSRQEVQDYRAKVEQSLKALEKATADWKSKIDELRAARDAIKPDAPEYAHLDAQLRQEIADDRAAARAAQREIEQGQAQMMIEEFRKIESAVTAVSAKHGLALSPPAQPAYPANVQTMNLNQVRALLLKRQIPLPANTPDLTDEVARYLDAQSDVQIPGLPPVPPLDTSASLPAPVQAAGSAPVTPASAPASNAPKIIDYVLVFSKLREARIAKNTEDNDAATARNIEQYRAARDAHPQGSPDYVRIDGLITATISAGDEFKTVVRLEAQRESAPAIARDCRMIEYAVAAIGNKHGLPLRPATQPAIPTRFDGINAQQVWALFLSRQLARPDGAPDLTQEVLDYLNSTDENSRRRLPRQQVPASATTHQATRPTTVP